MQQAPPPFPTTFGTILPVAQGQPIVPNQVNVNLNPIFQQTNPVPTAAPPQTTNPQNLQLPQPVTTSNQTLAGSSTADGEGDGEDELEQLDPLGEDIDDTSLL